MTTFLIDNEEALCRHLASKAWNDHHRSVSDKELQEKMQKENEASRQAQLVEMLNEINSKSSKKDKTNWSYLKMHQPKKYAKLMNEKNKKAIKEKNKEIAV